MCADPLDTATLMEVVTKSKVEQEAEKKQTEKARR